MYICVYVCIYVYIYICMCVAICNSCIAIQYTYISINDSLRDHPSTLERCREDQHGPCARTTGTSREVQKN